VHHYGKRGKGRQGVGDPRITIHCGKLAEKKEEMCLEASQKGFLCNPKNECNELIRGGGTATTGKWGQGLKTG